MWSMTLIVVIVVVVAAGLVLVPAFRRSRAHGMTDERQFGNHYTGGEAHGTPPEQGWGGGAGP
jgi:hypothetical protein